MAVAVFRSAVDNGRLRADLWAVAVWLRMLAYLVTDGDDARRSIQNATRAAALISLLSTTKAQEAGKRDQYSLFFSEARANSQRRHFSATVSGLSTGKLGDRVWRTTGIFRHMSRLEAYHVRALCQ
jgi:hypothetical protein